MTVKVCKSCWDLGNQYFNRKFTEESGRREEVRPSNLLFWHKNCVLTLRIIKCSIFTVSLSDALHTQSSFKLDILLEILHLHSLWTGRTALGTFPWSSFCKLVLPSCDLSAKENVIVIWVIVEQRWIAGGFPSAVPAALMFLSLQFTLPPKGQANIWTLCFVWFLGWWERISQSICWGSICLSNWLSFLLFFSIPFFFFSFCFISLFSSWTTLSSCCEEMGAWWKAWLDSRWGTQPRDELQDCCCSRPGAEFFVNDCPVSGRWTSPTMAVVD